MKNQTKSSFDSLGLYIHMPWCIKKCPYCDFNSHSVKAELPERQYVDVLLNDLQQDLNFLNLPKTVSSLFIGGGTPSLFSAESIDRLLSGISKMISLQDNVETTLEANPGTFESDRFVDYQKAGINRLSIGIQSFNDQHLKNLGRIHTGEQSLRAVEIARQAGFDNLNLDLMFGLPNQTNSEMIKDVQTAIRLNPGHISFYQLTLEPNTHFYQFPPQLPEDDQIFSGQLQCLQLLSEAGYQQYEVSAFAKNNAFCRHNLNYWQFGDYLGIGAGGHGKLTLGLPENIIRTVKQKHPDHYLTNNTATINRISLDELPLEFLMNHLRLKDGFSLDHFQAVTGLETNTLTDVLSDCIEEGLLRKKEQKYFCSETGWRFLDTILEKLVPESF